MTPFSDIPYIDFHTHRRTDQSGTICVVSMNGVPDRQADYFTSGYHPWWLEDNLSVSQLAVLEDLYTHNKDCLGIGECGLDALRGLTLERQEENFIMQLEVASRCGAPVIIHCVRAFDRLLRLARTHRKTPWVVHGFVRNKMLARQVLDQGIHLSVAPAVKMTPVFAEMLTFIPLQNVFLETDSEHSLSIDRRYAIFADLRGIGIDLLKDRMFDNFKSFFAEKWKYHDGWSEQNS